MLLSGDVFQPHEIYEKDDIEKVNALERCFMAKQEGNGHIFAYRNSCCTLPWYT